MEAVVETGSKPAPGRVTWRWLLLAIVVVILDQWTKNLVVGHFELFERLPVMPYFDLVRLHNTGAAFSFLANASGWQNWFFGLTALLVSGVLLWWFFQQPAGRVVVPLGLVLVLGGAIAGRFRHSTSPMPELRLV